MVLKPKDGLQIEHAEWIREQAKSYSRNRKANPGRKKYQAQKRRSTERLHSYINHELNVFLQTEKPKVVYMAKLPGPQPQTGRSHPFNKKLDHSLSKWQRGYIRKRLEFKCREHSVEIVQVLGKDISNMCSSCGAIGIKRRAGEVARGKLQEKAWEKAGERAKGMFFCPACGTELEEKTNTARNAKKRGIELAEGTPIEVWHRPS